MDKRQKRAPQRRKPISPVSVGRWEQAKKAYAFFVRKEVQGEAFTLQEVERRTGYTPGTIKGHRSKRWWWFLQRGEDGTYTVQGLRERGLFYFINTHRQKSLPPEPAETIRVEVPVYVEVPLPISGKRLALFLALAFIALTLYYKPRKITHLYWWAYLC